MIFSISILSAIRSWHGMEWTTTDDDEQLFMPSGAATIYLFVVNVNKASEGTRRENDKMPDSYDTEVENK